MTVWAIKLAIACGLIGIVVSDLRIQTIALLWERVSVSWFVAGMIAFYAGIWSMTRRYWLLIGSRTTFHGLLRIVLYQNIMGNLIATSAGAAWYVGALRTGHNIPVANGLLSLLIARCGDLIILLVSLSLATLFVWQKIPALHFLVTSVIFLLAVLVVIVSLALFWRTRFANFADRMIAGCGFRERTLVSGFLATFCVLILDEASWHRRSGGPFMCYSLCVLAAMLLFAYCNLKVFGVTIDIWPVIFVVSITQVVMLLPVHVLGGLGLQEISYLYLYGLFDINQTELAAVVVGLRMAFIFTNVMVFVLLAPLLGLVPQLLVRKTNT